MMKFAVLSDIHGNNFALTAVIADTQKENVNDILFLGDLITDFAQGTRAVLDTVQNLDAHVIKGNREGYMIGNSNGDYGNSWIEHKQFSTNLSTYRLL